MWFWADVARLLCRRGVSRMDSGSPPGHWGDPACATPAVHVRASRHARPEPTSMRLGVCARWTIHAVNRERCTAIGARQTGRRHLQVRYLTVLPNIIRLIV